MIGILAEEVDNMTLEKTYSTLFNQVQQKIQDVKNEMDLSHIDFPEGKQLRPRLFIISFLMCHPSVPETHSAKTRLINTAVALELLHEASLIHDDILDSASTRRGKATIHTKHGKATALVIGDILFCKSVELIINTIYHISNAFFILKFIVTASNIAKGEMLQQLIQSKEPNAKPSVDEYLKYIRNKTAILFAAACELGALHAGQKRIKALEYWKFGESLGMAFQIRDDLLDLISNEEALGKDIGKDYFTDNLTLPYILGYQSLVEQNLIKNQRKLSDFTKVQKTLEECGAIKSTKEYYQKYFNEAMEKLSKFPNNEAHILLQSIIDKIGDLKP